MITVDEDDFGEWFADCNDCPWQGPVRGWSDADRRQADLDAESHSAKTGH